MCSSQCGLSAAPSESLSGMEENLNALEDYNVMIFDTVLILKRAVSIFK